MARYISNVMFDVQMYTGVRDFTFMQGGVYSVPKFSHPGMLISRSIAREALQEITRKVEMRG